MELILKRIAKRPTYTIGRLYIAPLESPQKGEEGTGHTESTENTERAESPLPLEGDRGRLPFCNTLEPPVLEMKTKVSKEAVMRSEKKAKALKPFAIPEGRYAVVISWSPKLQQWLPILLGVPMFSGIRIHAGNTVEHTKGCILVGQNLEKGKVFNSRTWLNRLKEKIVEAKNRGEGVWITVK